MHQETPGIIGRGFTHPKQMDGVTGMFLVFGIIVFAWFGLYVYGKDMEPFTRILYILLTITVICLGIWVYQGNWRAKEGFAKDVSGAQPFVGSSKSLPSVMSSSSNSPYVVDSAFPINGVDDYEYNMVFQNEGDRAMTKQTRDTLMNKYPRDWSVMPSSSELFQQGLAAFQKKQEEPFQGEDAAANPYAQLDGPATPPDTQGAEATERQILQTYVPQSPQSLTTYDAADAKELVNRVYGAKGLIADMRESQPNVFTIIGTRKKDEKIVYEDEVPADAAASNEAVPAAGEGVIQIPAAAMTAPGVKQDPFFNTDTPSRQGKWDYTKWTPGMERMFSPTQPQQNWF
jgi:hypothetical protein